MILINGTSDKPKNVKILTQNDMKLVNFFLLKIKMYV